MAAQPLRKEEQLEDDASFSPMPGEHIRLGKGSYYFAGITWLILGIAALILPTAAALTIDVLIATLLIIGGLVHLVSAVRSIDIEHKGANIVLAIVSICAGGLLLFNPFAGIVALTVVLAIAFTLDGLSKLYAGSASGSALLCTSGLLSLGLAFILVAGWPAMSAVALGFLFGIGLIFAGMSMLAAGDTLPQAQ